VGYIPTTLVPSHDFGPPLAAPSADETAEQHAAQTFGAPLPILLHVPDWTWSAEPPAVAPIADATAEESVARQYGGGEAPQPGRGPAAEASVGEPPWEASPAADETAEQNAARQYGDVPTLALPGAPGSISEPDWAPYVEEPPAEFDPTGLAHLAIGMPVPPQPAPDGTWITEPIVAWPTADETAEQSAAAHFGSVGGGQAPALPVTGASAEPAWEPLLEFDATLLPSMALGAPSIPRPAPDGTWVTEPIVVWPAADATAEESVARQYGERPQPGALGGTSDVFEPAWFTILPAAVRTGQGGMFGRDEPYGGAFGRDEVASGAMGQDEPYGGAFARDGG